jgi:hypothetical protein
MAIADLSTLEHAFSAANTDETFALALNELSTVWPQLVGTAGSRLRSMLDAAPHELWHSDPWLVTCYAASFRSAKATNRAAALPYFEAARALLRPTTPAFVRATHYVWVWHSEVAPPLRLLVV